MDTIRLGKTNIVTNKNGFGALPIQRISRSDAAYLLRKALDGGITYFDTARGYTDSEEKIGYAFDGIARDKYFLASKTTALETKTFWENLETSLRLLKTDYIDVYQFHNPPFCPGLAGDETGLYEAALEAQKQGKIRFISITNHRLKVAQAAIESGLYATLQFPFSYLASDVEKQLVLDCEKNDMGFISMKALAGGLIRDSALAYAFQSEWPALPIWGIQREDQLDEFLSYIENPPAMTDERRAAIEKEQKELAGDFCRGCGYCTPCPEGIQIFDLARMSLMLRRAPVQSYTTPEWQEKMHKVEHCRKCGLCASRCPYGLDTPKLLEENYKDYWNFIK